MWTTNWASGFTRLRVLAHISVIHTVHLAALIILQVEYMMASVCILAFRFEGTSMTRRNTTDHVVLNIVSIDYSWLGFAVSAIYEQGYEYVELRATAIQPLIEILTSWTGRFSVNVSMLGAYF